MLIRTLETGSLALQAAAAAALCRLLDADVLSESEQAVRSVSPSLVSLSLISFWFQIAGLAIRAQLALTGPVPGRRVNDSNSDAVSRMLVAFLDEYAGADRRKHQPQLINASVWLSLGYPVLDMFLLCVQVCMLLDLVSDGELHHLLMRPPPLRQEQSSSIGIMALRSVCRRLHVQCVPVLLDSAGANLRSNLGIEANMASLRHVLLGE
jgi:hypothetical protein